MRDQNMDQSPCKADSRSTTQEISRPCTESETIQEPFLSQMNSVHTLASYSSKIHFNITLPSTPRSSNCSLPFRFSDLNFCIHSSSSFAPYVSHSSYNHFSALIASEVDTSSLNILPHC